MTRSHVLFHCTNSKLHAAREEAWEGKDPGGIRVHTPHNPRWERRLLRFLELPGVGRMVEGEVDGDQARAARMDIGLHRKRRRGSRSSAQFTTFSFLCLCSLRGAHTPSSAHNAWWERGISFSFSVVAVVGSTAGFFCSPIVYISLWDERT